MNSRRRNKPPGPQTTSAGGDQNQHAGNKIPEPNRTGKHRVKETVCRF